MNGVLCRQARALAFMGAAPDKVIFLDAPRAMLMEHAQRAGSCEDELLARLDSWDRLQGCVAQEVASRRVIPEDAIKRNVLHMSCCLNILSKRAWTHCSCH